ncbi:hypothetical protein CANINC_001912 [Pichia inconspicua]|uniref:mRNA 3'-end-processing protein RNA14 n=1 Tax=Pichia inconspicua TaxID=52247 RepID=A0A4T0X2I6_9ASCO|nr:hypothetical protein CANINC_001912 [[Candida] inconspicua]
MSDKARYALEKSIPELEDLEKKGLFTRKELNMIVRRRTDFEHRIAGRGSKPADFLAYVKFEKNVDRLRKKRVERLKDAIDRTPSVSSWAIPRRILYIFQRGTNKFPSSMELWAGYLKYARKQESVKVVYDVYSKLLSLQPRNVDVWLSGAKWEFEYNKNVKGARALFKRCLRFNIEEQRVWLEFIKLELNYLSKLLARRKLLQLVSERAQQEDMEDQERKQKNEGGDGDGDDEEQGNILILEADEDEINTELNKLPEMNVSTLGSIEDNPVLRGDLIMTLYDVFIATMLKRTEENERQEILYRLATTVLALIDQFDILERTHMCDYIIRDLVTRFPNESKNLILQLTLSLRYVKVEDDSFVNSLQQNVKSYQAWYSKSKIDEKVKEDVRNRYIRYLDERFLQNDSLDEDVKSLLTLLLKKL